MKEVLQSEEHGSGGLEGQVQGILIERIWNRIRELQRT